MLINLYKTGSKYCYRNKFDRFKNEMIRHNTYGPAVFQPRSTIQYKKYYNDGGVLWTLSRFGQIIFNR